MINMEEVTTSDGSVTFRNTEYDETYHSVSGAKEEAVKKFAEPCNLPVLKEATILDVCFGLGYNSAAALDLFRGDAIEIIALENDQDILDRIKDVDAPFLTYGLIQLLAEEKEVFIEVENRVFLKLLLADAKESIKRLPDDHFNVIFLDPFSPKKCPELWTERFLKEIYRVSKKGAILATYSCARSVRDNLKAVGFKVRDGPCIGRKAPSTVAVK